MLLAHRRGSETGETVPLVKIPVVTVLTTDLAGRYADTSLTPGESQRGGLDADRAHWQNRRGKQSGDCLWVVEDNQCSVSPRDHANACEPFDALSNDELRWEPYRKCS